MTIPNSSPTSGFVAGTLVHAKEGLKPIEEISVGDWVLSYPEQQSRPGRLREEHEYIYRQVSQTFVTEDRPLSKFIIANLVTGDKETFLLTASHPIYCENRGGWVPLSEIDAGDAVENYGFGNLLVFRVYHEQERARVYSFEVEEFHTYYVGENGVWVHNANVRFRETLMSASGTVPTAKSCATMRRKWATELPSRRRQNRSRNG